MPSATHACSLLGSSQIEVYEAAGSRYAELPSELYDVSVAYIAEAAARSQPALLDRALAALAAASAAAPAAIGQVNRRVGGQRERGVMGPAGNASKAACLHSILEQGVEQLKPACPARPPPPCRAATRACASWRSAAPSRSATAGRSRTRCASCCWARRRRRQTRSACCPAAATPPSATAPCWPSSRQAAVYSACCMDAQGETGGRERAAVGDAYAVVLLLPFPVVWTLHRVKRANAAGLHQRLIAPQVCPFPAGQLPRPRRPAARPVRAGAALGGRRGAGLLPWHPGRLLLGGKEGMMLHFQMVQRRGGWRAFRELSTCGQTPVRLQALPHAAPAGGARGEPADQRSAARHSSADGAHHHRHGWRAGSHGPAAAV